MLAADDLDFWISFCKTVNNFVNVADAILSSIRTFALVFVWMTATDTRTITHRNNNMARTTVEIKVELPRKQFYRVETQKEERVQ